MEQLSNAAALEQLNLAEVMDSLSRSAISHWLSHGQIQNQAPYPDVAAALVDWILTGNWGSNSQTALKNQLWAQA